MGRPVKYKTEEERIEAHRRRQRERNRRLRGIKSRDDLELRKNKHHKLSFDGLRFDVGTLDRINLNTMYIECHINMVYTCDEEAITILDKEIHRTICEWLYNQDDWHKKNKIYVFDRSKTQLTSKYIGQFRNVNFQLHLLRTEEPLSWKDNLKRLEPLVDTIVEGIKKACISTGLELAERPRTIKEING